MKHLRLAWLLWTGRYSVRLRDRRRKGIAP